jgi:hypothetical protein
MREQQAQDSQKLKEELKSEFRNELDKLQDRLGGSSDSV